MSSSKSYIIKQLLTKMRNPDADFRFMALTDLIKELTARVHVGEKPFHMDEAIEKETVDLVLDMVKDKNTEVKNQAVKTLGVLVKSVSDPRMTRIVDKLISYSANEDEQLRDLAGLALKTVVTEIPTNSKLAPTLCNKLTPKLITQLQDMPASSDTLVTHLDVLSDLLVRFDIYFRSNSSIQSQALKALLPNLTNPRTAVSKRVVTTLGSLAGCCSDDIFFSLISKTVMPGLRNTEPLRLKNSVFLAGVLARASPERFATVLTELVPLVVKVSEVDEEELRDTSLQTLESLLLKCPTEISSFIPLVINAATKAIQYDPNYAGVDESDEMDIDENENEEDDEDAEFGDEYSDDDDMSWKIRRAATKLLSTLIATRFELLQELYQSVSPVLVSRFEDREESVKLEVWSTFTVLLKQTKTFSGSEDQGPTENVLKRKRPAMLDDQKANGPLGLLRAQSPTISKSIIKCLNCKSIAVRQSGFTLLYELINVLGGGLETQILPLLDRIEASLKSADAGVSGSGTSLKMEVYKFLTLFFRTHHPRSFTPELVRFINLLLSGINDQYHRITSEAFIAASSLIKVLSPLAPSSPVHSDSASALKAIYDATMNRLNCSSADQEVKEWAATCYQDLITHAANLFESDFGNSLPIISQRLDNEITKCSTLQVVTQIARSPVPKGETFENWIRQIIPVVGSFLRKNNRTLKISSFECLNALLTRSNTKIDPPVVQTLISDLHPMIDVKDLPLLPLALKSLGFVIPFASDLSATAKAELLEPVYQIIQSAAIAQGPALDALISLFSALVEHKLDQPEVLIGSLVNAVDQTSTLEQAKTAVLTKTGGIMSPNAASGLQPYYTAARCIGAVVRVQPAAGLQVLANFTSVLQDPADNKTSVFFSLLCLGEIGRVADLSSHHEVFKSALTRFDSSSEDMRNAAAFAIGNMATGSADVFLPNIFQLIGTTGKHRHLPLQALKEFIAHAPSPSLSSHADSLWDPLFDAVDGQLETSRNVAAECLGKLTLSDASKFLPRLLARLKSPSPQIRMSCMTAVRFTLTDDTPGFDEQLAPFISEILGHIRDTDLSVRSLALSVLDSAAHNKRNLVRDVLPQLLPHLYAETSVDQSLVRFVEMGPFKHRVDDGLETRKLAYSTMLTLLETCLNKIDINEFTNRVLSGLSDEDEIKVLCYLMLIRLSHIAPTTIASRLDQSSEAFSATINLKLKDNSVKQDHERTAELQRSALRALVALLRVSSPSTSPKFCQLIKDTSNHPTLGSDFKELAKTSSSFGS
ncbi:hypothetical protein PGT21_009666 [Puccinia graminis f. sp. tritici]|uniref:TATA-binding protein interacting (TIP20) domain-containing protein n=1 Tax=Puccinia graminis f. sp. tritici TaxID=56615 RepID=A0A5B0PQJ2_PUCGR|nr:hypothetical protein PGT21_009666 [Puccinia graminis f. sp. tritici]KAA1102910.1 hypothetical protein PGTUg99_037166 [Puccinia graminis f. sp. tritici]